MGRVIARRHRRLAVSGVRGSAPARARPSGFDLGAESITRERASDDARQVMTGTPPTLVTVGFVVLPLVVAAGFVLACHVADRRLGVPAEARRRRTLGIGAAVAAWLLLTAVIAASGVLRRFDVFPPPFGGLLLAIVGLAVALACSPVGTRLIRGLP